MVDEKEESENNLDKLKERVELGHENFVEIVNEYDQCGKLTLSLLVLSDFQPTFINNLSMLFNFVTPVTYMSSV